MQTAINSNPKIFIPLVIILITILACNLPGMAPGATQDVSPGLETPTSLDSPQPPESAPETPAGADSQARADCLPNVFPGKTTRDEVIALLGQPVGVEQIDYLENLQYASPLKGQFNTLTLQDQVVILESILIDDAQNLSWSAIREQYGEPAHTAYSDYLQGSMTYAYPEQGLAFVADENIDAVFIKECYAPISLEEYLSTFGFPLPEKDPFIR